MVLFKTVKQISEDYDIPLATVYYRILKHHYRVNQYNQVLVSDVEAYADKNIKAGRPKGSRDVQPRKKRKRETQLENYKNKRNSYYKF